MDKFQRIKDREELQPAKPKKKYKFNFKRQQLAPTCSTSQVILISFSNVY
jgi:hypothetical protein